MSGPLIDTMKPLPSSMPVSSPVICASAAPPSSLHLNYPICTTVPEQAGDHAGGS
jgi:hypothetical protein